MLQSAVVPAHGKKKRNGHGHTDHGHILHTEVYINHGYSNVYRETYTHHWHKKHTGSTRTDGHAHRRKHTYHGDVLDTYYHMSWNVKRTRFILTCNPKCVYISAEVALTRHAPTHTLKWWTPCPYSRHRVLWGTGPYPTKWAERAVRYWPWRHILATYAGSIYSQYTKQKYCDDLP